MSEWNDCPICSSGMIFQEIITSSPRHQAYRFDCLNKHYRVNFDIADNLIDDISERVFLRNGDKSYELSRFLSDGHDWYLYIIEAGYFNSSDRGTNIGSFPIPFGFNIKRLEKLLLVA